MEQSTRIRNGMLALAMVLGVTACAGNGYNETDEPQERDMERPPAMENPAESGGSLESQ